MDLSVIEFNFDHKAFLWQWILVAILGSAVGFLFMNFWPYTFLSDRLNGLIQSFGFLAANTVIGLGEQLIFRQRLKAQTTWFLMTMLAAILVAILSGLLFVSMLPRNGDIVINFLIAFNLVFAMWLAVPWSIVFGIFQSLALRKIIRRAFNWIWISIFSSVLYIWCEFVCIFLLPEMGMGDLIAIVIAIVPAALSGAFGGLLLLELIDESAVKSGNNANSNSIPSPK
jgi:hypothetical protein